MFLEVCFCGTLTAAMPFSSASAATMGAQHRSEMPHPSAVCSPFLSPLTSVTEHFAHCQVLLTFRAGHSAGLVGRRHIRGSALRKPRWKNQDGKPLACHLLTQHRLMCGGERNLLAAFLTLPGGLLFDTHCRRYPCLLTFTFPLQEQSHSPVTGFLVAFPLSV